MFQNLMSSNPYSTPTNQDAAYLQAVYSRPHHQYTEHEQSIRSSPSWNSPSSQIVQGSSADSNHSFSTNHNPSPFSSRFPFQVCLLCLLTFINVLCLLTFNLLFINFVLLIILGFSNGFNAFSVMFNFITFQSNECASIMFTWWT